MNWDDLNIDGRSLCMAHLRPIEIQYQVAGQAVTVRFEFGFHCFTDDKGHGPEIYNHKTRETRYFSQRRYDASKQMVDFFQKRFIEQTAVAHFSGKRNDRRYYCMDLYEYAIFFEVRRPQGVDNFLRVHVITAYEVEQWGVDSLPRGKRLNVRYIIEKRNAGDII